MQALVTGASGFIGSEVVRRLLTQGWQVRCLLRETSSRRNLEGLKFDTILGDLSDLASLERAVTGVDYIFHLAGIVSARSRQEYYLYNTVGSDNLAQACLKSNPKIKRFVYVSSLAASGPANSRIPITEEHSELPVSAYGESKLAGEQAVLKWSNQGHGFPVSIVRPPVVYGPRDRGVFQFVKLVNKGFVPVFPSKDETGEKFYSLVHVDDIAEGILTAAFCENQNRQEKYFISGDGVYTFTDIISCIALSLGKKPVQLKLPRLFWTASAASMTLASRVTKKTFPLTLDKLKELNPDYWICSNERAKKALGFTPKYELRSGLAQTIEWYRAWHWI